MLNRLMLSTKKTVFFLPCLFVYLYYLFFQYLFKIYFSYLVLGRTFSTKLHRSGEFRHLCFITVLRKNIPSFTFIFLYIYSKPWGFPPHLTPTLTLYQLEEIPFQSQFVERFYHRYWILWNDSVIYIEMLCSFVFQSIIILFYSIN